MLGAFELRVDDQVVPITRVRLRALLCALAIRAEQVVATDTLAVQVWGEQVPQKARAGLHTLVNQLRGLAGADLIRTEPQGYALDIPRDAVDALRFRRLVDSASGLDPVAARGVLVEALSLWRGEPLAGLGTEHLQRDIAPALIEWYLRAVESRIDIDLALGKHGALVAELRALVIEHPMREPLWVRLITALHRAGRSAEALGTYQTIRTRLADLLGADPSAELRAVHAAILAAEDVVGIEDRTPIPRQLLPDAARFAGRVAELAELDRVLAEHTGPEGSPLVIALHGPGGIGKTALALHWAHRHRERFSDGQIYVDMRGYGPEEPIDPATALDVVLRAIGVPPARIPAGAEERSALLRTALFGRRTVLFMDNVRDASQVRPLLPGAGNLLLVTSRNELHGLAVHDGAWRLNLRELSMEDSVTLVGNVIGTGRVAAEPAAVVGLVELCDRLPLMLVIAAQRAARYPDTSIAGLVTELRAVHDRLDLLADPLDPIADPRAVFSWSYHALNEATARAFRYLGLHPGPEISLQAAVALLRTPPGPTRRLLDTLVSVHLLERDQLGRYRFHDLLREYAAEVVAEREPDAERDAAVRRVLDWYLHTMHRARVALFTPTPLHLSDPADEFVRPLEFTDNAAATAWYDGLWVTLLAVVEYATEHHYDRHGWQIAFLLRHFLEIRRYGDDELRSAMLALRCAERSGEDLALIHAHHMLGAALTAVGRYDEAIPMHLRAVRRSEQIGDQGMVAQTLGNTGLAHVRAGRPAEALPWQERSVAAARGSGQPGQLAHALLNLGAVEGMTGAPAKSFEHSEEALRIYRDLGSRYYQGFALGNMAEASLDKGDPAGALVYADEGLALVNDVDAHVGAGILITKGRAHDAVGQHDAARQAWERALPQLRRAEDPRTDTVLELLSANEITATERSAPPGC
jgi:DNA-binding SARP family transcriptional activator/tetratricopeptide (TPR) repeat protein